MNKDELEISNKTMSGKIDYEVKVINYNDTSYTSSYQPCKTELMIDSRGDRVSITMTEYRYETNRTTGASMVVTREQWETIKHLAKGTGGEL